MVEIDVIVDELKVTAANLANVDAETFIERIGRAKRIFVYGTGRSGLMLKAFAMRLMQLDYRVYVIGETITPSVHKGDLMIAASASGETASVCMAVEQAKNNGADVITITADKNARLASLQKPLIVIDASTKYVVSKDSVQPLGSLFEQMLLLIFDGISLSISKKRQDGNACMAQKHASIE